MRAGYPPVRRPSAETLDCLRSYLPKLALTHGAALATGEALMGNPEVPHAVKFFDSHVPGSDPARWRDIVEQML